MGGWREHLGMALCVVLLGGCRGVAPDSGDRAGKEVSEEGHACDVHAQGIRRGAAWIEMQAVGTDTWPKSWVMRIARDGCVNVRGGASVKSEMSYSLGEDLAVLSGMLDRFDWEGLPGAVGRFRHHFASRELTIKTKGVVHRLAIYPSDSGAPTAFSVIRCYLLWGYIEDLNRMEGAVRFRRGDTLRILRGGAPVWYGPPSPPGENP